MAASSRINVRIAFMLVVLAAMIAGAVIAADVLSRRDRAPSTQAASVTTHPM
jgi:hypothetical protein